MAQMEHWKAKLEENRTKPQDQQRNPVVVLKDSLLPLDIEDQIQAPGVEKHGSPAILTADSYMQGCQQVFVKHGLSMYDLLGLLPGGSAIESVVHPAEGASRGETMLMSGLGALAGTAAGGLGGAALTSKVTGEDPDKQLMFSLPAAGIGALAGGTLGNIAGRWLAERPKTQQGITIDELNTALEALKPQSGVTVNVGAKPQVVTSKQEA